MGLGWIDDAFNVAKKFVKGSFGESDTILNSNKPIEKVSEFLLGRKPGVPQMIMEVAEDGTTRIVEKGGRASGFRSIYNDVVKNDGNIQLGQVLKNAYTDEAGKLDYKAIAGSYVTGAAAFRVLSGGGLHRDSEGNPNLIGIPFV